MKRRDTKLKLPIRRISRTHLVEESRYLNPIAIRAWNAYGYLYVWSVTKGEKKSNSDWATMNENEKDEWESKVPCGSSSRNSRCDPRVVGVSGAVVFGEQLRESVLQRQSDWACKHATTLYPRQGLGRRRWWWKRWGWKTHPEPLFRRSRVPPTIRRYFDACTAAFRSSVPQDTYLSPATPILPPP